MASARREAAAGIHCVHQAEAGGGGLSAGKEVAEGGAAAAGDRRLAGHVGGLEEGLHEVHLHGRVHLINNLIRHQSRIPTEPHLAAHRIPTKPRPLLRDSGRPFVGGGAPAQLGLGIHNPHLLRLHRLRTYQSAIIATSFHMQFGPILLSLDAQACPCDCLLHLLAIALLGDTGPLVCHY